MQIFTIRSFPDEIHAALQKVAAQHGRSTEAEALAILAASVKPENRIRLGDEMVKLNREIGLDDADAEALLNTRDRSVAKPISFE